MARLWPLPDLAGVTGNGVLVFQCRPAAALLRHRPVQRTPQRVRNRQPAGRAHRRRRIAGQRWLLDPPRRVHRQACGEQRAGIGMRGGAIDAVDRAKLDDLAEVHHQHPVGHIMHDVQIVRDEDVGQAAAHA